MYKKKNKHIIVALCVASLTFSLVAMEEKFPPPKPSILQRGKMKVMGVVKAFGTVTKVATNIKKREKLYIDTWNHNFFYPSGQLNFYGQRMKPEIKEADAPNNSAS